jgi:hypothetical protein
MPGQFKIVRGSNSVQIRHSDAVLLNTQTNCCFVQKKVWPVRDLNRQEREILRAPERRAANISGYFDDPSWALHLSSADQKNNRAAKASKCWDMGNANHTGMRRSSGMEVLPRLALLCMRTRCSHGGADLPAERPAIMAHFPGPRGKLCHNPVLVSRHSSPSTHLEAMSVKILASV